MDNKKNQTTYAVEDVIGYLSDSVYRVSYDVNNINLQVDDVQEQVNNMKNNVQSLENEIRTFMKEMKQNAAINDAKQNIVMLRMEYDQKYKQRDEVRRRLIGLLQSVDVNIIKKSTMETIGEETIINNSDYWLSNALIAICYWYTNNKTLAETALKKALEQSEEKTAFLLCLIHLRSNRINTAIKWLEKYLLLQDPTNMDCKIILLLDALCSGVFGKEIIDIILNQIQKWKNQLNNYPKYETKQISTWEEYFKSNIDKKESPYPHINNYVMEQSIINDINNFSQSHINIIKKFKEKLNKIDISHDNYQNKIDKLINILILDYENEELELKIQINNNNEIINSKSSEENNIDNQYCYAKKDFYSHITNICINEEKYDIGIYTKKMAIALSKDYIIKAYNNIDKIKENDININIIIDGWLGNTNSGDNELELKQSISEYVKTNHKKEMEECKLFNKEQFIILLVATIVTIIFFKKIYIVIPVLAITIIYLAFSYYKYHLHKEEINKKIEKEIEDIKYLFMCTISEIVDYYFEYEENKTAKEEFLQYIASLDYQEYIKTYAENKRTIIIGDIK